MRYEVIANRVEAIFATANHIEVSGIFGIDEQENRFAGQRKASLLKKSLHVSHFDLCLTLLRRRNLREIERDQRGHLIRGRRLLLLLQGPDVSESALFLRH